MTLRDEAKETAGVTSALLLSYLDRFGGPAAVQSVLGRCGLEGCEAELRDENSWFSWETKIELFEATVAVLDKPDFLAEMASFGMDANVAGGLKVALRTLGSPEFVVRNIVRANARFNRSHALELLALERGHAVMRFAEIGDGHRYHRLDCDYTAAMLAIIPELFGLPPASVSHAQCAASGADSCVFDLRWQRRPRRTRAAFALGAASLCGAVASSLFLPVALPAAGVGAVVAAGLALEEQRRRQRDRWRHLERQVDDSEEVAQRLFASLQDLVSDLRLEEVVTKVTRNAQIAMGGRDFLLLVFEGDGLICKSASELPGEAIAAVEAWANGSRNALEASILIDDATAVPALARLAELDNPLCSLASAPLGYAGAPLGLLVALGGQQRMFLPRDMAVLESYAAQVAIALGNARLYQSERSLAARDPLTGLLNHRSFHEALDAELERSSREQFHSSLVLIDLDHFKRVNDEDGHAAGDRLLRAAARALSDVCRREDLAFRIGGDEFALLLPRLAAEEGRAVAERVRSAIRAVDSRIAASTGVATAAPGTGKDDLIAEADRRLYDAKGAASHVRHARGARGAQSIAFGDAVELVCAAIELEGGAVAARNSRLAQLAQRVAARMDADPAQVAQVRRCALLHGLPWAAPGSDLLARDRELSAAASALGACSERWDGTGYPHGIAGSEIPFAARIIAVCGAFEELANARSPQDRLRTASVLRELHVQAGTRLDPEMVRALESVLAEASARV